MAATVFQSEGGYDLPSHMRMADDNADVETAERSLERFFASTMDSEATADRVRDIQGKDCVQLLRFELDLDSLREVDVQLAQKLLSQPMQYYKAALNGLRRAFSNTFGEAAANEMELRLSITGSFGTHLVTPRGLKAEFLSHMVSVEGIVTKLGMVKPKLVKLVQYCRETNAYRAPMTFHDGADLSSTAPTAAVIPMVDDEKRPLEVEFGECTYRDYQKFTIQEMPERAPLGQLPRSIEVIIEDDLVDQVKPGDRVCCTGIYRALNVRSVAEISGMFKTALICNTIQRLGKDVGGIRLTSEDIARIREVAQQEDAFHRLSRSLAPSIYGHEYIKKAILLLLLGGVEKVLENGTHLRGDINCLIVGDPSTAKSQLLRFVLGIAPLAISTTGRGSTGVGLTAAVTSDPDTGERRLEAGAMVLADRGVVLIDEFDKMGDGDRVAIHEVMEQQTVTIAKAGIHASLNARCSVVAAANPIYGQYNKDLSPQRNINLPDSLLSRFDLLFVVLDNSSADTDRAVADHVLRIHRYQVPGKEGKPIPLNDSAYTDLLSRARDGDNDEDNEDEDGSQRHTEMYEKFNPVLHPPYARTEPLFSIEFMRKFIFAAKMLNRDPQLTEEARQMISDEYAQLRSEQATKTLPITPRCLETLIRLSTAHAKCRFSNLIEPQDVEVAQEVLRFALYNDTQKAEERRKQKEDLMRKRLSAKNADASDSDEEDEMDDDGESQDDEMQIEPRDDKDEEKRETEPRRTKKSRRSRVHDDESDEEKAEEKRETIEVPRKERHEYAKQALNVLLPQTDDADSEPKPVHECLAGINAALKKSMNEGKTDSRWPWYTIEELREILDELSEDNFLMVNQDIVYRV